MDLKKCGVKIDFQTFIKLTLFVFGATIKQIN